MRVATLVAKRAALSAEFAAIRARCADEAPARLPLVLVVDDDPTQLMLLREALRGTARVVLQRYPEDALSVALEVDFDAVLLDIHMPEMSGYEFARRLHEVRPGAPIIAATGDDAVNLHALNGTGARVLHLPKPFRMDEARRMVEEALA